MAATYDPEKPPPHGKFSINVDDLKYQSGGYIADITLHPGVTEKAIQAHISDKNCMAIVMTSLGAGNIPEQIIPTIKEATEKYNLPIFSVSPFVGGAVHANMYESAQRAHKAGVAFPGDQSSSTVWVKAHWLLANGLGMTSKDFILNMQRVFRGEGTASKNAEILPPGHEKRTKRNRNTYSQRILRNYTGTERYRGDKGNEYRYIKFSEGKRPVLPRPDLRVLKTV